MLTKYDETLHEALDEFGFQTQVMKAIEEMAELTNALIHFGDGRAMSRDVIEEIADVLVMCRQLTLFFGQNLVESVVTMKVRRLKKRIKDSAKRRERQCHWTEEANGDGSAAKSNG